MNSGHEVMKCAFANVNVVYIVYSSRHPSIYSVFFSFFFFLILLLNFFQGICVYLFDYRLCWIRLLCTHII